MDRLLASVGEFGPYQKLMVGLLCLPAFLDSYNGYGLVFLVPCSPPLTLRQSQPSAVQTFTPDHVCRRSANFSAGANSTGVPAANVSFGTCSVAVRQDEEEREEPCLEWDYDKHYFESTLVTRWNLVCESELVPKTVLSVITAATVVGCLACSYVSDRWGRKRALLLTVVAYVLGSSLSLLSPSVVGFTALRLLASFNAISTFNIAYVWALESVGPAQRTLVTTLLTGSFAVAMASLSLVAWLCRDWRQLGLATSLPFVGLLSFQWLLPESPTWLLAQRREEEATRVLQRMLRHKPGGKESAVQLIQKLEEEDKSEDKSSSSASVLDLFRGLELSKKTLIVCFCFTANVVVFTSISYNMENLGGNLYVTWAVQSLVEAPATALNLLYVRRFGVVRPLGVAMTLSGLCCLLTVPASEAGSEVAVLALAFAGKFAICSSYALVYQAAGQVFPTVVRSLGIGLATVVGNVGNVLMPYIIFSATAYRMLPMAILGLLAIVGGLLGLLLPETSAAPLPQTLADAEASAAGVAALRAHFSRRDPHPS